MRDKRRYVLVETSSRIEDDEKTFSYNLYRELIRCIGESDYHKVNPRMMKIVDDTSFVIKSDLKGTGNLILALSFIKRLNNKETAFYTIKSSGTIRALLKAKSSKG